MRTRSRCGIFLSVNQKLNGIFTQAAGKSDLVLIEKEGKEDFGGEALVEDSTKGAAQEQETKAPYQPKVNDDEVYENGYILIDKDRKAALEIYGIDKTKIRKYTDIVNRLAQKLLARRFMRCLRRLLQNSTAPMIITLETALKKQVLPMHMSSSSRRT